ncbi:hypothetical protein H257_16255 [Aphanomyces astaci]|uniref:Uncharacterized protein n=1 Tax=Aphanomyces astaci TaxID=112090 RepID=W4FLB6_APHAT|nr:hypothetical protein H257_16255 [Aphanomyces astaci]ETV67671.1 hypothetical protein H257_16255 [Aphanomyces astaci]|eukprot:XP_009842928.1 hypothetical protein H257_16255 [Aphanomyces astaci]
MGKFPEEVTDAAWAVWFTLGFQVDPRTQDSLKKRVKASVVFDMSIPDADSQIGRMFDGMAAASHRDRQEWIIREESADIVKIITEAVKPVSLHRAVTEQMARNKPLKKDVYRFAPTSSTPGNGCLKCKSTTHKVREYPGITDNHDCLKHIVGRLAKNVVTGAVVTVGLTPAED